MTSHDATALWSALSLDQRAVAPERGEAMSDDALDAALVRRAREGDRAAAQALFARHADDVAALTLRLLRHRADAEEAAQDALVYALGRLHQLREPGEFRRWIRSIAVNECRRKRRAAWWRRVFGRGGDAALTLDAMASPSCAPEVREALGAIDAALRTVPVAQRDAWTLHAVEGMTLPETASACGCSLATVKRWIAAVDDRIGALAHREVPR